MWLQNFVTIFLLLPVTVLATSGTLGLDVSQPYTSKQWSCLSTTTNRTWGVVRSWHSYGGFDTNAPATLSAAKTAGLTMDVYLFPCFTKDPKAQATDMVNKLSSSSWNSVWIDVETNPSTGCGWSKNFTANCQFLQTMITSLTSTGTAVGVYSSHFEWGAVMGTQCEIANHLPLWYARYDSVGANCEDYKTMPFGGWLRAFAKQYSDHGDAKATKCGFKGADMNVIC